MSYRKPIAITLMLCFAFTNLRAMTQDEYESGAIKTSYGFLLVWNKPNNHYTLEIRGKNVRQISTQQVRFSVDGMFLQIVNAPTSNFIASVNRKTMDDKAILEAHRDWEVKFMEGDYKEKLKVESSWQKLSNGKDALVWQINVPDSAHSNVTKQISLTLMRGDFVLMLGGVVTDTISESASRQLLLNTAETLKTSDQPIDLRKLQESIRKVASNEDTVGQSKTTTIKGKVFRSDTKEPIPNALIILVDESKSDKVYNSVGIRTDELGNYTLEKVPAGMYTVTIRAWYKTQEEAPCKLLLGKTSDKNSSVLVAYEEGRFVQQVMIKGFTVEAGKNIPKDFDFACKSMFGN